jgi:hypothetical protein
VDHVADVAEVVAVVQVPQHAGEEHAEHELVEALAAARRKEVREETDRDDRDDEEQRPLALADAEDGAAVFRIREVQPPGDEPDRLCGAEVRLRQHLRPQVQREPRGHDEEKPRQGGGGAEVVGPASGQVVCHTSRQILVVTTLKTSVERGGRRASGNRVHGWRKVSGFLQR